MRKLTIDEMRQFAHTKKGKCLSFIYKGCHSKLKWKCHMGHVWTAPYVEIRKGSWCPKCARENRKDTIEEMEKVAKQKGGQCLSKKYVKNSVKLRWQCSVGHNWMATPNSIKRGSWCKICWFEKGIKRINRKHSIDEAIAFAKRKGGNCLSTEYINSQRSLKWVCKYGHIWNTNFNAVVNCGSWCPECAGHKKHNIEVAQQLAKEKGGECLSQCYEGNKQKLLWRCANGHEWLARFDNVKSKTWCPKCPKYFNEEKCRYIFESLLNLPFIKTKEILYGKYELDGYCQSLNLAFEYHGEQHYKLNKKYMKNENVLIKRQASDKKRRILCRKLRIKLIEIPYWESFSDENLIKFIKSQLNNQGIIYKDKTIDFGNFYTTFNVLEELRKIAKQRGGKCLTKTYISNSTPIEWECTEGHRWFANPSSVKPSKNHQGTWCRRCAGLTPHTLQEAKLFAKDHGGECLSKQYINGRLPLIWKCEEGHIWKNRFSSMFRRESWCRKCAAIKRAEVRKLGIDLMHQLAKERRGKCLSCKYVNSKTKLKWQCELGHIWETTPANIKKGSWCIECSYKERAIRRRERRNSGKLIDQLNDKVA